MSSHMASRFAGTVTEVLGMRKRQEKMQGGCGPYTFYSLRPNFFFFWRGRRRWDDGGETELVTPKAAILSATSSSSNYGELDLKEWDLSSPREERERVPARRTENREKAHASLDHSPLPISPCPLHFLCNVAVSGAL